MILVSDERWDAIEPLLPPHPAQPRGGRPWLPDHPALCGMIFVLRTGIQWRWLSAELGCGSGVTGWRRLRDWERAGVWHRLHRVPLDRLDEAHKLDWSRARGDSASIAARKGATRSARTRRIVASQGPSAIPWSIAGASPSRRG
jgi:transposase